MTKRHITAAEVERDAQGYWTHPAMRAVDLETAADFSGWLREQDLEAWVMLMRDEAPALFLAGFDDEDWDASGWMPRPPAGDGWFLGSLHDHDDGPVCLWLRPTAFRWSEDTGRGGDK
ncbi:TPA: hypothetical protein RYX73_004374 [Serratia marcescens]|uniref:hypothetical protein n=1 Tax=Serratia marcescens TaxID=615 RepID=UPI001F4C1D16|nr:hypothetical protein [Serratia marcescens]ULG13123.1 hypothetical protein 1573p1_00063 [Serratia marcescens]HEB0103553.1 hypothetical protein [Serratia marcescens]